MNIGLFFGSFNPIHIGHLIIANTVANSGLVQKVWLVVSPQNPLKDKKTLLDENKRYHLVNLAIDDNPKLKASNIEFKLPKPSYTIDTLAYLSEKYPQHNFSLIMGSDTVATLPKWKNYELLIKKYSIIIYNRPDTDLSANKLLQLPNITTLEAPLLTISASYIRNCILQKKSIKYLVAPKVEEEINNNRYYK